MKRIGFSMIGATMLAIGSFPAVSSAQQPPVRTGQPSSTWGIRHPNSNFEREFDSKVRLAFKDPLQGAYVMAGDVARCVARRKDAGALIGGAMTGDERYDRLATALGRKYSSCVNEGAVGVPMVIINGALAEELVKEAKPAFPERHPPVDVAAARAFYTDPAGVSMETVGRCMAAYSPGLSYRVLGTRPGSQDEVSAMTAMFINTPECGVKAAPADISLAVQRSAVATGLFFWSRRG